MRHTWACVQGTHDGVPQIFPHAPVAGEELVGPPAEQERVGALVHLVDEGHGLAVEQRPGPSAPLEPGVEHVRPAVCLHHSIDGDLRGGRQFHDRGSLRRAGTPRGRPLTPATNASAPIRHRLADFFRGLSGGDRAVVGSGQFEANRRSPHSGSLAAQCPAVPVHWVAMLAAPDSRSALSSGRLHRLLPCCHGPWRSATSRRGSGSSPTRWRSRRRRTRGTVEVPE
jgi:hypothetical protein